MPHDGRLATVHQALRAGATVTDVAEASGIDPWFVDQVQAIEEIAERLSGAADSPPGTHPGAGIDADALRDAKRAGFSDAQIGQLARLPEDQVRLLRHVAHARQDPRRVLGHGFSEHVDAACHRPE